MNANTPQPDFKPGDRVLVEATVTGSPQNNGFVVVEFEEVPGFDGVPESQDAVLRIESLHPPAIAAAPPELECCDWEDCGERAIHAFCPEHEVALRAHPVGAAVEVTADELFDASLEHAANHQGARSAWCFRKGAEWMRAALSAKASGTWLKILCSGDAGTAHYFMAFVKSGEQVPTFCNDCMGGVEAPTAATPATNCGHKIEAYIEVEEHDQLGSYGQVLNHVPAFHDCFRLGYEADDINRALADCVVDALERWAEPLKFAQHFTLMVNSKHGPPEWKIEISYD